MEGADRLLKTLVLSRMQLATLPQYTLAQTSWLKQKGPPKVKGFVELLDLSC